VKDGAQRELPSRYRIDGDGAVAFEWRAWTAGRNS